MGNYYANSYRVFNQRGQRVYDGFSGLLGVCFFVIVITYAGFRGHRVVTQLPATYRTTQKPSEIPIEMIKNFFPSSIPSPTYEFPALTICADDPTASITLTSCRKIATAAVVDCDKKGISSGNITVEGNLLNCISVNEGAGVPLIATSSDDVFDVSLNITGVRNRSAAGVLVQVHDQVPGQGFIPWGSVSHYENFFAASAYFVTEIVSRKVYEIDLRDKVNIHFETKASSMLLNMPINASAPAPLTLEITYPKLECTYEKEFLPLDMYNWLGEVGGVAALLALLHRGCAFGFTLFLFRSKKFYDIPSAKKSESFSNY